MNIVLRYLSVFALVLTLGACANQNQDQGADADAASEITSPEEFMDLLQDRVFFGYDRYDLVPDAKRVLDAQVAGLGALEGVNVVIEGHCDERGTREYNLALGDRRANAVKRYMVSKGVSSGRIKTISYGKEKPAVMGEGESVWSQNRRGVTVLIDEEGTEYRKEQ